jgi:hypothetical protein
LIIQNLLGEVTSLAAEAPYQEIPPGIVTSTFTEDADQLLEPYLTEDSDIYAWVALRSMYTIDALNKCAFL